MNWCSKGEFRQDLYHRIFVFPITLPPLRDRSDDIPLLVDYFARSVAEQNDWKAREITADAYAELKRYSWPGNVRELRNVVERLLLLSDDRVDLATVRQALPMAEQAPSVIERHAVGPHGRARARGDPGGAEKSCVQDDRHGAGSGVGAESSL